MSSGVANVHDLLSVSEWISHIEVLFTNLMLERSKSFVKFFTCHKVYGPLEGMIEEEFMPLVEGIRSEEKRRACHEGVVGLEEHTPVMPE